MKIKTFKDLNFATREDGEGLRAQLLFNNGHGVSVVRHVTKDGYHYTHTSNSDEWEVAILKLIGDHWDICYDSGITDDVICHCNREDVNEIMKKVQKLK